MNRPLTFAAAQLRRQLWRKLLSEMPPDEADRVREDPTGPDGLSLAVAVELLALAQEQQHARNAARLN